MQKNHSPWLKDKTKQYINPDHPPVPRIIVAAANLHVERHIMLVGSRHWSKAMRTQCEIMDISSRDFPIENQGFIDQFDQFVTRDEAKEIVIANKQKLARPVDLWETLYSENLY